MIITIRSRTLDFFNNQPEHPDASIPIPMKAAAIVHNPEARPIPSQCSRIALPAGKTVNMNGMRKAVIAYFHDIMVVLKGSPPVIAAAAKGERAGGGETSDSKA